MDVSADNGTEEQYNGLLFIIRTLEVEKILSCTKLPLHSHQAEPLLNYVC
jgi:hypothetical protein